MFKKLLQALRPGATQSAPEGPLESASTAPADRQHAQLRAEGLIAQGNALEDAGDPKAALQLYAGAVQAAPGFAKAHLNLGLGHAALGELDDAARAYGRGLELDPGHPFLLYNLGHIRYLQGQFGAARDHAHAALDVKPDFIEARVLLSNTLDELGRPELALREIEAALALEPALSGAHLNRVRLLLELLRPADAAAAAREGLELSPEHAELHWSLAIACLLQGEFETGWREHEWRARARGNAPVADYHRPSWNGDQRLDGRSILLFAEQGLGDSVQMLRFVPTIADRACQVVLSLPAPLVGLAQASVPANCSVIDEAARPPETDFQCALMSLPLALGIDGRKPPGAPPYLRAEPGRAAAWRRRLDQVGAPIHVGIVWSGNPAHRNDRRRSIPLAGLVRLAATGANFVALQPEVRASDEEALRRFPRMQPWGSELGAFADTAALMEALDLVITVDTSTAHVAGALGRPVWILLPYLPDWRWMMDRNDSPWYPTARLYRQSQAGDWESVLDRVCHDLQTAIENRPTLLP